MFKLKALQEKNKQAAAAPATGATTATTTNNAQPAAATTPAPANGDAGAANTYVLKKQGSKELTEIRKQKSKENVMTLKSKQSKKDNKSKQNAAEIRVQKDLGELEATPGITFEFPDTNNLMQFRVKIKPNEGLYVGAEFNFTVDIPITYPYDPPKAHCNTLVYHPNIDWEGHVCLNILRQDWMPVLNLGSVLFGLMTLFLEPNADDPLNQEAADLMLKNPKEFERNVKQTLRGGYVLGRNFPKLI